VGATARPPRAGLEALELLIGHDAGIHECGPDGGFSVADGHGRLDRLDRTGRVGEPEAGLVEDEMVDVGGEGGAAHGGVASRSAAYPLANREPSAPVARTMASTFAQRWVEAIVSTFGPDRDTRHATAGHSLCRLAIFRAKQSTALVAWLALIAEKTRGGARLPACSALVAWLALVAELARWLIGQSRAGHQTQPEGCAEYKRHNLAPHSCSFLCLDSRNGRG